MSNYKPFLISSIFCRFDDANLLQISYLNVWYGSGGIKWCVRLFIGMGHHGCDLERLRFLIISISHQRLRSGITAAVSMMKLVIDKTSDLSSFSKDLIKLIKYKFPKWILLGDIKIPTLLRSILLIYNSSITSMR